jgi:O-antigen ligase
MRTRPPRHFGEQAPVPFTGIGLLTLALACAWTAPALYWMLLGAAVVVGVGFLAFRHTVAFCVVWLLVTGLTLEMALNDLVGPAAFQTSIAVVKGGGVALALVCVLRYGARFDPFNPSWGFVVMTAGGLMHGLYPGLTMADSFRSLAGSAAPYVFGFSRLSRDWAQAIIRTTIWCPTVAVAAGVVLAAAGLRPLFVESGGARLAALGHPAFLAGVCLPAIYAGLIELWRDGRSRDRAMLAVNILVLVLTGARAPLAYALAVSGLTLLTVPSPMVPLRHRLFLIAGLGLLLPPLVLLADELAFVRLFNVLSNETGNLSGRQYLWPAFQAVAAESPWFGWGLGAGNVIIPPDSHIAQMLHTWAAHNEYLRMQVEGGEIGRGLLILLFISWACSNTTRLPVVDRRIMRLVFVAFAAHAFTDNVLISTPACVLFALATAVFARGRHERAEPACLPGAGQVA